VGQAQVFVLLKGLIDLDEERGRLEKKLAEARGKLAGVERKLANESFVSKAPDAIVQKEREKAADLKNQVDLLEHNLADLS